MSSVMEYPWRGPSARLTRISSAGSENRPKSSRSGSSFTFRMIISPCVLRITYYARRYYVQRNSMSREIMPCTLFPFCHIHIFKELDSFRRKSMVLITGVTGHVGRRVAEILSQRGLKLRLMGRDTAKLPRLSNSEPMSADYADPASLDKVMSGIERAFIVSGHSEPGQRAREHRNVIQAAARAGVKHLVYTSFQGASPDSKFPYSRDHYQTEKYLKESGVPFTALRDSM